MTEQELFEILTKDFPDLEKSSYKYSSYDCFSIDKNIYIELKCRRSHYDLLLIEKLKYDRLVEAADLMKMLPVYICSTPEGIYGFSLRKFRIEWEDRQLPASTDFDNKEMITKKVGYLPVASAKKFR